MEADIAALGEPDHIGILVKDVDKAVKFLSSIGFGPWRWLDFVQEDDVVMVNGRTRQKIAFANIGNTVMEVIEPIEGGGYWPDFIAATNGGVNHIAFNVPNWDEMVSKFRERGGEIVAGGIFLGKRWCYLKANTENGNMIIEFMENFGVRDVQYS